MHIYKGTMNIYVHSAFSGMCSQMKVCSNYFIAFQCILEKNIYFWFKHLFLYSSFISEQLVLMPNMSVSRLNEIRQKHINVLVHILLFQCDDFFLIN